MSRWKTAAYHFDKQTTDSTSAVPEPSPHKVEKVEKKAHVSVILPRVYECDAKDYYDTELLLDKALHADWEQHMKKPKWLERQDKDVFRELNHFYPALVSIFRYFSALGDGGLFKVNKNEFNAFIKKCNIKQRHMGVLWAAVNQLRKEDIEVEKDTDDEDDAVEEQEDNEDNEEGSEKTERGKRKKTKQTQQLRRRTRVTKGEGSDKNDINSLERYEFIEMILAIANEMLHQKRRLEFSRTLRYVVVEKIFDECMERCRPRALLCKS